MPALSLKQSSSLLVSVLATLALAFALGLVLDHVRQPTVSTVVERAVIPDRRSQGERAVETAQKGLVTRPDDPRSMAALAQAYLLRARESGDPGYYSRADALLGRALAAQPDDIEATLVAGSLALTRHEFETALELGRRAVQLAPYTSAGYGVLTDALVELGRYDEAVDAAQKMVDLRPDLASYSRVAYLRELYGDLDGAVEAMRDAVKSGAPSGEATAWTEVQLGHLLFAQGGPSAPPPAKGTPAERFGGFGGSGSGSGQGLDGAERAYNSAMRRLDNYAYGMAGLARVRAARGDLNGAAGLYERAAQILPLPEFVIALGDTYTRLGDTARAEQQYALVGSMQKLLAANGVRTDLELALFNADRGTNLDEALQAAHTEYGLRRSVQVADTLAWVEYRRGELPAALEHSREALRLGTRDPLMLYHAGVIAQANGEPDRARELLAASSELNPKFSILWSEDLAARLRQLSAAGGRP